jgi:hypothetical protein
MESLDALSALDAKRQAEAQLARAVHCPPWRHAVFGLMMGLLVASAAFEFPVRTAIIVLILCSIPAIVHSDRKRMGMFINGYRRGKTRIVAVGLLCVELSLYAIAVYYGLELHDQLIPLLLGVVAFVVGIAGSLIWQRVFVREMGA